MADLAVRQLDVLTEGTWDFNRSALSWSPQAYAASSEFDPFPGYAHDLDTVETAANRAQALVTPLWPVTIYVTNRESAGRTNGYSNCYEPQHYDETTDSWVRDTPQGMIVLCGKRIQPHPAMTRYLVAHEYGHNVEWMISKARGNRVHDETLIAEYAKLRGIPGQTHHGSGGRWHDSAHEIFACDYRLIVLHAETEFWPHPGIPRPEGSKDLANWWATEMKRLAEAAAKATSTDPADAATG